jgi:hypothetical protein
LLLLRGVSCSWSHSTKGIMRQAAHSAGITATLTSQQLQMRGEPEAAAVSVLQEHAVQLSQYDSLLLIDEGGGTVDLSLHEVASAASSSSSSSSSFCLKELVPCAAELAGASFVDAAFAAHLLHATALSRQQWQAWVHQYPGQHRLLKKNWEIAKRGFGLGGQAALSVELPQGLINQLPEPVAEQLMDNHNCLVIAAEVACCQLFDPCIAKVISRTQQLLSVVGSADFIFLAGGFSESPYLRSWLQQALCHRAAKGLFTCSNGSSAVLKGEQEGGGGLLTQPWLDGITTTACMARSVRGGKAAEGANMRNAYRKADAASHKQQHAA